MVPVAREALAAISSQLWRNFADALPLRNEALPSLTSMMNTGRDPKRTACQSAMAPSRRRRVKSRAMAAIRLSGRRRGPRFLSIFVCRFMCDLEVASSPGEALPRVS